MARFIIKVHSRTGTPLGAICWADGRVVVSEDSNPRFIEAVDIMLDRGSPLPVRNGDQMEHLSINRSVFSTLKNIKKFLEKSFGFKAIIAGAEWNSDQLELGFIKDDCVVSDIRLNHLLALRLQRLPIPQFIKPDSGFCTWDNAVYPANNRSQPDTYILAA